jgi:hypothetical protein
VDAAADVAAALRLGLTQGAVISFSRSWGEHCFNTAEVAQLNSALQAAANHDVTVVTSSGDTGAAANPCPGWDPATGWGSPNAQVLVPLLARYASPAADPA